MSRINWQNLIVIDPEIHHGEPCIKGTRVPVAILVGSIADGMSVAEFLEEFPQLKKKEIQAALEYAS